MVVISQPRAGWGSGSSHSVTSNSGWGFHWRQMAVISWPRAGVGVWEHPFCQVQFWVGDMWLQSVHRKSAGIFPSPHGLTSDGTEAEIAVMVIT